MPILKEVVSLPCSKSDSGKCIFATDALIIFLIKVYGNGMRDVHVNTINVVVVTLHCFWFSVFPKHLVIPVFKPQSQIFPWHPTAFLLFFSFFEVTPTFITLRKIMSDDVHWLIRKIFGRWLAVGYQGVGIMPLTFSICLQRTQEKSSHFTGCSLRLPKLWRQHLLFATEDMRIYWEVSIMVRERQAIWWGI